MIANVLRLPTGPHWRVLIAHQRSDVRHVLRTLIEAENVASYKRFTTPDQLLELVANDVAVLLTERFVSDHEQTAASPTRSPSAFTPALVS